MRRLFREFQERRLPEDVGDAFALGAGGLRRVKVVDAPAWSSSTSSGWKRKYLEATELLALTELGDLA